MYQLIKGILAKIIKIEKIAYIGLFLVKIVSLSYIFK